MESRIFGIDFDGTVVKKADFPAIGAPVPYALSVLHRLQQDHRLILWTVRAGEALRMARKYLKENDVNIWAANRNPQQKSKLGVSPKASCDIYIDDKALGCPLITSRYEEPYVDWIEVANILRNQGLLVIDQKLRKAFSRTP